MEKTILLAGGTGLIGTRLRTFLELKGYKVLLLTRNKHKASTSPYYYWDPTRRYVDVEAIKQADFIVNLAGEGIVNERWSEQRKKELIESRKQAAEAIKNALLFTGKQPLAYISASAIGWYGIYADVKASEDDMPAGNPDDFLMRCCVAWENAANEIAALQIRTVILRIGVVLSLKGGALAEIAKPLSLGVASYFGDGNAWYSWIHINDVCNMICSAIEQKELSGVYNAVAPVPVRNKELVIACKKASKKLSILMPVPSFAIKLAFGEMSAVVLNSTLVSSKKIEDAGFKFEFPTIDVALDHLFSNA